MARIDIGNHVKSKPLLLYACPILIAAILIQVKVTLPKRNPGAQGPNKAKKASTLDAHGKLPRSFEAIHGQTDASASFLYRGNGYTMYLTPSAALITVSSGAAKAGGQEDRGTVRETTLRM